MPSRGSATIKCWSWPNFWGSGSTWRLSHLRHVAVLPRKREYPNHRRPSSFRLGVGRIVVSETDVPNMLAYIVHV
jgi:hypothetical protein